MADRPDGWSQHATDQRRAWSRLSHADRLRWLEQAKQFNETALGAARRRGPRKTPTETSET